MFGGVTSRPASHSSTRVPGSSLSREAIAQPAEPPPMMRKSIGSEGSSIAGHSPIALFRPRSGWSSSVTRVPHTRRTPARGQI